MKLFKFLLMVMLMNVFFFYSSQSFACEKKNIEIKGRDGGEWWPFSQSCLTEQEIEGEWIDNNGFDLIKLEIRFVQSIKETNWFSVRLSVGDDKMDAFGILPLRNGQFKGRLMTKTSQSIPLQFYKYNGKNPGDIFYKLVIQWPNQQRQRFEYFPVLQQN